MPKKHLLPKSLFILLFASSIILLFYFSLRNTKDSFLENVMWISGLLGVLLMTRQSILWVRSMVASRIKDFFWVNSWHKWLWIWTIGGILLHPFLIELTYAQQWISQILESGHLWINIGDLSRTVLIIILVSSFILRTKIKQLFLWLIGESTDALTKTTWTKKTKSILTTVLTLLKKLFASYRLWFWMHLFAYLALAWVRLHAWFIWTKINTIPSMHVYWIVLWCIILFTGIMRLAQAIWMVQKRGEILANTQITTGIFEMHIQLPRKITYSHGQFVYLQYKSFGEAHPFTVLTYDKNKNVMRIAYKISGPFTKKISLLKQWASIFVDGPYGVFTSDIEKNDGPIVCIAWWIGITPFYHLVKTHDKKNITLLYLNRNFWDGPYEIELDQKLAERIIHVYSREIIEQADTRIDSLIGKVILWKRIDKSILQDSMWENLQNAHYYICWSQEVIKSTSDILTSLDIKRKNIHWEIFWM